MYLESGSIFTGKQMKQKNGFGLLEVMFATAIFIVVVGSMVTLSRLSLRNAVLATHRAQAFNLAQDGLEVIRQMRDTNWIDGIPKNPQGSGTLNETEEWYAYVHDCTGSGAGDPTQYAKIVQNGTTQYSICFDVTGGLDRFGLIPVPPTSNPTNDPNRYMVLRGSDAQPDPNAPLWFDRTITFEPVPSTELSGFKGLQFLTKDAGAPAVLTGIEPVHLVKVKAIVKWRDFDKEWSLTVSTILSNWKTK